MSDTPETKKWTLSDTIFVSTMPAIAYGVAYFFEVGYISHYGLPEFLVSISLERFFYALSIMTAIYVVLINYIDIFLQIFLKKLEKINLNHFLLLFLLLIPIIYGSAGLIIKGFNWLYFISLIVGTAGVFFIFINPAIGKRGFDEYVQELDRINASDREIRRRSLTSKIVNTDWGNAYIAGLIIICLFPHLITLLGSYVANKQNKYLITQIESNEFALIRKYGEDNILVEFQRKWKTLYSFDPVFGSQIVIKKNSDQPIFYDHIKISRQER